MGRPRKQFGTNEKLNFIYGRFYMDGEVKRIKLIDLEDLEYKETKRGPVARSLVERSTLLTSLYSAKELELTQLATAKQVSGELLLTMFERWLETVRDMRAFKTYQHYQKAVFHFFDVNSKNLKAKDLLPTHLSRVAKHIKERASEETANSYLRDLKRGLSWGVENDYLNKVPKIPFYRTADKDPEVFTDEELELMLRTLLQRRFDKRRWECLLRSWFFLRWTGIRGSELLYLKWENVFVDRKVILLRDTENFRVKGRREEMVPMPTVLQTFLCSLDYSGETWILDNGHGQPYWAHLNELSAAMRKFQNSLGISGPKPLHGFRSTLATQLTGMEDANVYMVQELLRHVNITTTMGYVNKDKVQIGRLIDRLEQHKKSS